MSLLLRKILRHVLFIFRLKLWVITDRKENVMPYASIAGRARANPSSPRAFAVCDRCGIWYNHVDLQWQFDWRGASLMNLRLLVCRPCYDDPQQQLRAI